MATARILKTFQFARALGSRAFALLWIGQTISRIGDFAFITALAWQVLLLTHSGTAMGLVLVASSIPQLLFLLIGGVAADRLPKLLVLLCSDSGRALAVLIIAVLGWMRLLQLWHLIGLSLIFGVAQGFFYPTYRAIPPQLVETEMLASANALTGLSQQMGTLLGPLIGATLVAFSSPAFAFAFDGTTFVVSALCILLIRNTSPAFVTSLEKTEQVQPLAPRGMPKALLYIREGAGYVLRAPWLWVSILVASLANVATGGALQVSFPRLVTDFYHAGVWLLGALGPAEAVGSLLGTLLIGQLPRVRHRGVVYYLSLVIGNIGIALMGLPLLQHYALFAVIAGGGIMGVGYSIAGIIWVTVLQELVPADKQGRVFSIDALGSFGLRPIGYALVGLATDAFGPAPIFLCSGLLNIVLCLAAPGVRGIRDID